MPKQPIQKKNKLHTYAKYSGIAFQMGVVIGLSVFLGLKIDAFWYLQFPVFALILSLVGVVFSIYLAVKDVIKNKS